MQESNHVELEVEGMTCSNCALSVRKFLEKRHMEAVNVNFATGEVSFHNKAGGSLHEIKEGIETLGYKVKGEKGGSEKSSFSLYPDTLEKKFLFCAIFTFPLLLHMILPWPWLHDPWVQIGLSAPVYIIGLPYFGKSAWHSIRNRFPNMDVLIFTGAFASLVYSFAGFIIYPLQAHEYLFFETGATIITLVLLGNLIEHRSVKKTTSAIAELNAMMPEKATRISRDAATGYESSEEIAADHIRQDDILFVRSGEKIAVDGIITQGKGSFDESMLTGESMPAFKSAGEQIFSGTILTDGAIRFRATAVGKASTLAHIIDMVKNAQASRPSIQKIGDQVSVVFVQVVLVISLLTFLLSFFAGGVSLQDSIMRSVAVLVISCPCAMGLATPTAVMVGLGQAARNGLLIKGGATVEELAKAGTFLFDKTGTLTSGNFLVSEIRAIGIEEAEAKNIIYQLEQISTHPIARSIQKHTDWEKEKISFKQSSEEKGRGVFAEDHSGNSYALGSYHIAQHLSADDLSDIYLLKNNELVATLNVQDEIKPGAAESIQYLKTKGIQCILLSGDKEEKCASVAKALQLDAYHSRQLPGQKLDFIEAERKQGKTIVMVGDGINDAPALSKANVGISLSGATDIARQSAQVVILGKDLNEIRRVHKLAADTYTTIKQNLFWALAYNVVAIPIAALGFLNPMAGALSMAFSDVIVIGNSLRLRTKKI